jgi:hypothetical protein
MDSSTIDPILQFQQLVGARAAYPLVAAILTFTIQIAKASPYTKVWLAQIPNGLRFLTPVVAGAAMGFVHGYQTGHTVVGALVETFFGICGVSLTSMGLAAGLKESPIPWGGTGAGGVPLPASDQKPS